MQKARSGFLIIFIYVFAVCLGPAARAASADTEGENVVFCKGHGTVTFQGDGTISINGDGILIINDADTVAFTQPGDAEGEAVEKEPECFQTEDGSCIYVEIDGIDQGVDDRPGGIDNIAIITGENLEVSFTGANIGVKASGNANLMLKGYGIYIYKSDSISVGRWTFGGTTVSLEN